MTLRSYSEVSLFNCLPGKFQNTAVTWVYLHLVRVKVTQLCPTLCNPMDYTVHGIL